MPVRSTYCQPLGLVLFFLRHLRRCRRSLAHDQENGVLVLGAIPMHLLTVMGHETAGRHWNSAVLGVEFRTGTYPPGALQHDDVAVVGMEMRAAEMIALGPFGIDDVKAGL